MLRQLLRTPLIQRNKKRARLLLYLTPVVLFALGWLVVVVLSFIRVGDWRKVDYWQYEEVRLFQRFLRINTVDPSGNEIPAAELLARELAKDGIEAHVERLGPRNANLWAILEGADPRALVLHNHLDTDPVTNPEGWTHPPFSGFIDLPFIYGRGAFDMKSVTIAQLMAMKSLARDGLPLKRSLVFLATSNEENGSWLGTRFVLRHHPELWRRFEVVLTEGGAVEATDLRTVKYWGTETFQKLHVQMRVCSSNLEALKALREDLVTFDYDTHLTSEVPGPVLDFLRSYVPTRDNPETDFYFADALGGGGAARLPRNLRAMMTNGKSAFPIEEDPEGGYSFRLVLHLLPWEDVDQAMAEVLPGGLPGFAVSIDVPHGPITDLAALEHPIFERIHAHLLEAYDESFPHGPIYIPWASTDARFFRAQGIPAYGFSPFLIVAGDASKITGTNERMALPAFVDGVELYRELVADWVR